jgi:hypothetical protein
MENDDYKVDAKTFVGKDIIHIAILTKAISALFTT